MSDTETQHSIRKMSDDEIKMVYEKRRSFGVEGDGLKIGEKVVAGLVVSVGNLDGKGGDVS